MEQKASIESHYTRTQLFETIMDALEKTGIDTAHVTRKNIAGVDEFHVRGQEVTHELVMEVNPQKGNRVLDVGCGLGGTCRMLADEYDCVVTGIDITAEYIRTATLLSSLVGLSDDTSFIVGSAMDLPFVNDSFDMVWTQHVQMNIEDKQRMYTEIARVLVPAGQFIYYDIFSNDNKEVYYPTPWAAQANPSHLITNNDYHHLLQQSGLTITHTTDQTIKGIQFFDRMFERIKSNGVPTVGLNLLMGDAFIERIGNLYKNLKEGSVVLESGVGRKGSVD
jgi:ubiquinone/menaquinone biosynthesis C-methylase UbiE